MKKNRRQGTSGGTCCSILKPKRYWTFPVQGIPARTAFWEICSLLFLWAADRFFPTSRGLLGWVSPIWQEADFSQSRMVCGLIPITTICKPPSETRISGFFFFGLDILGRTFRCNAKYFQNCEAVSFDQWPVLTFSKVKQKKKKV